MSHILLLLENEGNRHLLQEWFDRQTDHDVRDSEEGDPFGKSFDLCIVDGSGLEAFRQELHTYREECHPEFVPVLLLVPHDYADRLDETVWDHVDDIIWTSGGAGYDSLDTFEFEGRIRSLLRTRKMSRTLKENQERLQVVQRVLRHNVRNSLNAIRGNAELIADSGEVERVGPIIQQTDRLLGHTEKARRVNDILDTDARYVMGLGTKVEELVQQYREEHPGVNIIFDAAANPQVTAIQGMPEAIGELIENGIIHDPGEEPVVTVRVFAEDGWGVVSITDTGPAIPDADRRILTGDQEPTAVDHGQGVGLWLVAWTVRRSDGTVDHDSRDQGGNRITVRLPVTT